MLRLFAVMLAAGLAAGTAGAQEGPEPFVWTDPETECRYLVAPGAGITPRLRRDGAPDCPDVARIVSEDLERSLRRGGEELGRMLQEFGRRLEETPPR